MPHAIRPMRSADLDAVCAVQAACYPPAMQEPRDVIAARLDAAPATCIVACDGAPCAYLFAYPSRLGLVTGLGASFQVALDADTIYLHDLAIAPPAHGRGLARELVSHMLLGARRAGLRHAALVSVQDTARFWEGFGFRAAPALAPAPAAGLATYPGAAVYMTRALSPHDPENPA